MRMKLLGVLLIVLMLAGWGVAVWQYTEHQEARAALKASEAEHKVEMAEMGDWLSCFYLSFSLLDGIKHRIDLGFIRGEEPDIMEDVENLGTMLERVRLDAPEDYKVQSANFYDSAYGLRSLMIKCSVQGYYSDEDAVDFVEYQDKIKEVFLDVYKKAVDGKDLRVRAETYNLASRLGRDQGMLESEMGVYQPQH